MTDNKASRSFPLTPIQEGMLFHQLAERHVGVDVEQIWMDLPESLDPARFEEAWSRIHDRHDRFRVSFSANGSGGHGGYVQRVGSSATVDFDLEDVSAAERPQDLVADFLREDRLRPFDLERAPLSRVKVFKLAEDHYQAVWTFHHILMDGRSFAVVLRDLFDLYDAGEGREAWTGYERFVMESRKVDREAAHAFWADLLGDFESPNVISDTGPAGPDTRGEVELGLSPSETAAVRARAEAEGVTLATVFQAAWALTVCRFSGEGDVVFGATRAGRRGILSREEAADAVGVFINTLPVRCRIDGAESVGDWLRRLRQDQIDSRPYEQTPLVDIHRWAGTGAGQVLFESNIVYDHARLGAALLAERPGWQGRDFRLYERAPFPLTLYGYGEEALLFRLAYDHARYGDTFAERLVGTFKEILASFGDPERVRVADLGPRAAAALETGPSWAPASELVHTRMEEHAATDPDRVAITFQGRPVTYGELDARATSLSRVLREQGVALEDRVGICLERSDDLLVAVLAVLKAGAAYVPLDPTYPQDRLAFMVADSGVKTILSRARFSSRLNAPWDVVDMDHVAGVDASEATSHPGPKPDNLAYVIYTSGSTGQPKGVMVEHRNVVNFFEGMDERIPVQNGDVLMAVTSLSFDISVLELLWTLSRGVRTVIRSDEPWSVAPDTQGAAVPSFSLFYFAAGGANPGSGQYRILMDGAKFADENGFEAVWTPERHFHEFGGLYPNPSVVGAAIAAVTKRVKIRAGSVVIPLHDPVRVAEEWSVVDNLSDGRVGISIASGWHPNDFVLSPGSYEDRKAVMMDRLETIKRLWRGDSVERTGPKGPVEVRLMPRPVQPELPVWITSAGNPDTFRAAGEAGTNVLTHMLGQTFEDLQEKLSAYRQAWTDAGHDGHGHVTLMLHTFVGDDDDTVREIVREPMKDYLRGAVSLVGKYANAWTAYRTKGGASAGGTGTELAELSDEDREDLLEFAFHRYYETSGLFGSVQTAAETLRRVSALGIDEIGCLIDFGVAADEVLASLPKLVALRAAAAASTSTPSLAEEAEGEGVTHFQCTPSLARMILADEDGQRAMGSFKHLMVGGEAFPQDLAAQLLEHSSGRIMNMYGPTETTIWSSTHEVTEAGNGAQPLGGPITNTSFYLAAVDGSPAPVGAPGELWIGGAGVVRGYHERPELTEQRFVTLSADPSQRFYRTGDSVRRGADGSLTFLGRLDHQVKIRGHRIELGEIEARLSEVEGVEQGLVMAREDTPGDQRLVAYVVGAGDPAPLEASIRESLAQSLPEHMVPDHVVFLREMPLTPNRKVDRNALPSPRESVRSGAEPGMLRGMQAEVARIWKELLGVQELGLDENFFDAGGHSLLTVQVHRMLKSELNVELRLTDLFRFPTIRTLAAFLEDQSGAAPPSGALAAAERRAARRRERRRTPAPR